MAPLVQQIIADNEQREKAKHERQQNNNFKQGKNQ
jgi:hypothetical protein